LLKKGKETKEEEIMWGSYGKEVKRGSRKRNTDMGE